MKRTTASAAIAALVMSGVLESGFYEYPKITPEEPKTPRQPEVDGLSKKARKIYCKVLRETQDREMALAAALELENI